MLSGPIGLGVVKCSGYGFWPLVVTAAVSWALWIFFLLKMESKFKFAYGITFLIFWLLIGLGSAVIVEASG